MIAAIKGFTGTTIGLPESKQANKFVKEGLLIENEGMK